MSLRGLIYAIGERERIRTLAFAGVQMTPADDPDAARAAWAQLPEEVGLVLLTGAARDAIAPPDLDERLWVVMPE